MGGRAAGAPVCDAPGRDVGAEGRVAAGAGEGAWECAGAGAGCAAVAIAAAGTAGARGGVSCGRAGTTGRSLGGVTACGRDGIELSADVRGCCGACAPAGVPKPACIGCGGVGIETGGRGGSGADTDGR